MVRFLPNDNTRESKIEKLSEQMIDMYLNSPDIRNPILQIDILGPVVDFVVTTLSEDLHKKRLLQTFQIIHEEITRINENMVDFSYIKGEEFHDNMRRLIEYSIRTRHEEKIRWYCRILIGSALLENVNERRSAEDILIFLSELTTTDILVGKEIYEIQKDVPDISSKDNRNQIVDEAKRHRIKDKLGLNEVDFRISLIKLSRVGLIRDGWLIS
jgi:hypothetical protein